MPKMTPPAEDRAPSMAEIGRALGLSRQAVHALHLRGMPVHSVEAAHDWRLAHLDPARRKAGDFDRELSIRQRLAQAQALMTAAADALAGGNEPAFKVLKPALREALSLVPEDARSRVAFVPDVLGRLLAELKAYEDQALAEHAADVAAGGAPEEWFGPNAAVEQAEFQRQRDHEPPSPWNYKIASGEWDPAL